MPCAGRSLPFTGEDQILAEVYSPETGQAIAQSENVESGNVVA